MVILIVKVRESVPAGAPVDRSTYDVDTRPPSSHTPAKSPRLNWAFGSGMMMWPSTSSGSGRWDNAVAGVISHIAAAISNDNVALQEDLVITIDSIGS